LHAAVHLELPEHLAAGHGDVPTLAKACQCSSDGLHRLLRALCTLEVCSERRDGRFELTASGAVLCREPPDGAPSLRAMTMWWGGPMWPVWGDLAHSVRTGHSARERHTGMSSYAFLDARADIADMFHEAMHAMTVLVADEVAHLATWRDAREVVDVGGGVGALAAAIARANPRVRVTVLDRADAEPGARAMFARHSLAARARFVAGDFFSTVPADADRYLLKSILHNWDNAACARILARCAEAVPRGASLLLVERIRPNRLRRTSRDEALARTDLNMLAGLGGRERSLSEFSDLLGNAGFEITAVSPTRHEFCVVETRRR
jgi:SAM-dependent methyltransferase